MAKIIMRYDTSSKSKSNPIYFWTDKYAKKTINDALTSKTGYSSGYTINQGEIIKRALEELGIVVDDQTK